VKGKASKWWLYLPGAIAFGLGSWQIVRREDKVCVFLFAIQFVYTDSVKLFYTCIHLNHAEVDIYGDNLGNNL